MTETTLAKPATVADDNYAPGPIKTPPASPLGVLVRMVIAFIGGTIVYGPALLVRNIPGMNPEADLAAGNWASALVKIGGPVLTIPPLAVGLIWLYNRFIDHRPFKVNGIRFDRRAIPTLLIGTAISLVVIVPASVLLGRLGLVEVAESMPAQPIWFAVIYSLLLGFVMQGATEEFLWRGWLSQSVGGGWWRQAIITAIAFGLIHILSNGGHATFLSGAIYVLNAAAFGFAASALYFATGSIWAAVGIHGGLHLSTYVMLMVGGGDGSALKLVTITLYLLIGIIVMRQLPDSRS